MKRFNNVFKSFFVVAFVAALLFTSGCASSKVEKGAGSQLSVDSAIKQGTLDNGMTYLIRENKEPRNRIQLRLVVKAGSCMEEDDQKGIAHFVEHMCFNGTKNFEKSAIVDYFESLGMQFGPEVNAETSFEQTVYMLELPADNLEMLKTSLLVLHDWACAVTFDPEEIEKERGVIVEEWRMRMLGIQGRISDKEISVLMKDSRYGDRLPIGDMEIIKNISRERIVDFYEKWYRPENMAVIAVGDVDTAVLESAIKEIMGEIPASSKKTKLPSYKIPAKKAKTLDVIRDKELGIVQAEIYLLSKDLKPVDTVEQLREEYAIGFAMDTLNLRLSERTNSGTAPWLAAGVGKVSLTNKNYFYVLQLYPKTGMFEESFKVFLDEYERFMTHGITDSELERLKQAYLMGVQQNYANKDKQASAVYAANLVNYVLTGNVIISEEDKLKLSTEIINQITPEEILAAGKETLKDRGNSMFVLCPEAQEIPSDKEILDIWKNYQSESAKQAYVDDTGDGMLMQRPEQKAKVTEKKAIKELGGTQYTFENGVKIITKKTDFQKDTIAVYAGSKGGMYQLKEEEVPSAKVSVEYVLYSGFGDVTFSQIQKIATAKNLSVNFGINNTEEYFNISANKNNLEESLQMVNLVFTSPKFDAGNWNNLMAQYSQIAEAHGARPGQVFTDKINETVYGRNMWHSSLNKDFVAKMDAATSERVFRERFGNAADFTFVFVGDFDEDELVDLCAYYLGTIKTNKKFEETKYVYFPFPKKSQTVTVNKGIDENGEVYMCFGGELPKNDDMEQSYKESTLLNQLAAVLEIRLREIIREDKSGSYGVSCSGLLDGWPERFYEIDIEFGCEPAREEELAAVVIETIEEIKKGNISDEIIAKVKETYIRNVETSFRNNYWWINRFSAEILYTYEPLWFTTNSNKAADWITKEAIIDAAKKYLNTDRVVTAYLKPEIK